MAPKIQTAKKGEIKKRGKKDPDSESEFDDSDMSSTEESSDSEEKPRRKPAVKKVTTRITKKDKKSTKSKAKASTTTDDDEEEVFDKKGYTAFLASIFPSKFSKKKAEAAAAALLWPQASRLAARLLGRRRELRLQRGRRGPRGAKGSGTAGSAGGERRGRAVVHRHVRPDAPAALLPLASGSAVA